MKSHKVLPVDFKCTCLRDIKPEVAERMNQAVDNSHEKSHLIETGRQGRRLTDGISDGSVTIVVDVKLDTVEVIILVVVVKEVVVEGAICKREEQKEVAIPVACNPFTIALTAKHSMFNTA